jgi:hypothetical protein
MQHAAAWWRYCYHWRDPEKLGPSRSQVKASERLTKLTLQSNQGSHLIQKVMKVEKESEQQYMESKKEKKKKKALQE